MKRIIQFFAVCLACSALQTGSVIGAENVRTSAKRDTSKTVTSSVRTQTKSDVARTTTKTRTVDTKTNVKQRSVDNKNVISRPATTSASRSATKSTRTTKTVPTKTVSARTASRTSNRAISRAGTIDTEKLSDIKSKDYSRCKTVYYECMDEFCANKDTNLRRCACSSRIHEFDNIKKQLNDAEDKMLDFNQRLLIVNLDKEDAAAINVATDGELAFAKTDTSESEKLLQKITKALNTSGDSKINNDLASISLSLDMDSAWDSVDSLSGIATTAKSGLDLYNAATPVCVEMAREVCSDEELSIAQSGYKLTIQQDCNTVAKSYNSQYNNAMNKIHESSALLDMARLNNYQQRNSDDVLTCKKKMLTQLSDESVCGENLYKCLDTTGQYINPSTGAAFLSKDLYDLTGLLTVPTGDEKWSKIGQNEKFVAFLNSKKKFLEPATEQCQDMADAIWQDFIEDALAQIKLAQNSKIEEIRQSCTTLVSECKINNQTAMADFDARALSTFSVMADTTINAMCSDIEKSCTALLENSGGGGTDWAAGMSSIAANISYDEIIETCTTVGKDCIIRQCTGTSGNFALCQDFESNPRHAILTRQACWKEVLACIEQSENVNNIASISTTAYDSTNVYPICDTENDTSNACLLAEKIWGNCEYDPTTPLTTKGIIFADDEINNRYKSENKILAPKSGTNLLQWFAMNTGTADNYDSCNASPCPVNYVQQNGGCYLLVDFVTSDNQRIQTETEKIDADFKNGITNYCQNGIKDYWGNCCVSGTKYKDINGKDICVPDNTYYALPVQIAYCTEYDADECNSKPTTSAVYNCKREYEYYCGEYGANRTLTAYCFTTDNSLTFDDNVISCNGFWGLIDNYGNYFEPYTNIGNQSTLPTTAGKIGMSYKTSASAICTYQFNTSENNWEWNNASCGAPTAPKEEAFMIKFN